MHYQQLVLRGGILGMGETRSLCSFFSRQHDTYMALLGLLLGVAEGMSFACREPVLPEEMKETFSML